MEVSKTDKARLEVAGSLRNRAALTPGDVRGIAREEGLSESTVKQFPPTLTQEPFKRLTGVRAGSVGGNSNPHYYIDADLGHEDIDDAVRRAKER